MTEESNTPTPQILEDEKTKLLKQIRFGIVMILLAVEPIIGIILLFWWKILPLKNIFWFILLLLVLLFAGIFLSMGLVTITQLVSHRY
jgi:hypothetical protein